MLSKFNINFRYFLWTVLGILFIAGVTTALSYGTQNQVFSPLGNFTNSSAGYFIGNGTYLTGVCLSTGTNCPPGFTDTQKTTNGFYLYNDSTTIYFNETKLNNTLGSYITYNGATSDVNLNSRKLTNVGGLIMNGLITSQNITPTTNNLYSLGNSTNWFNELFVKTLYTNEVNTTNLTAIKIDSTKVNTTNLTVGGFDIYKDGSGDLNIDLD